jgi:hypothetical protein
MSNIRRGLALAAMLALCGCIHPGGNCNLQAANAAQAGQGCARSWMDANLHVNDIVTVGTHNSYKEAISPKIFALVQMMAPQIAPTLDYSHIPLDAQLNDGARAIEIDVAYDPKGGLFAHPMGPGFAGETVPADYSAAMAKPGFKVLHFQDVDYRSNCLTLIDCLMILKTWSHAHPDHVPILVGMNAKDDSLPNGQGTQALKFDAAAFDALDAEVRSVMAPSDMIAPDDIQGTYPTLRDAVLKHGWPSLGASRGKFIFALDEGEPKISLYRNGRKSLEGRVFFVNAPSSSPVAAFLTMNEAQSDSAAIANAVKLGFLVRTRADADTVEARKNDTKRRDKAFASGAQFVSTDYMEPDPRFGLYQARMPKGVVAACDPVRVADRCAGTPVEAAVQ